MHDNRFWIYFGDPDLGIFMTTATDPPLTLVREAKGWIDRGASFRALGDHMPLREGRWMGAKFGLVATRPAAVSAGGFADIDWVRVK